jgi:hypothetical protein
VRKNNMQQKHAWSGYFLRLVGVVMIECFTYVGMHTSFIYKDISNPKARIICRLIVLLSSALFSMVCHVTLICHVLIGRWKITRKILSSDVALATLRWSVLLRVKIKRSTLMYQLCIFFLLIKSVHNNTSN